MKQSPKSKVQSSKKLGGLLIVAVVAVGAARCASTRVSVRDAFPLDPREELAGPFAAGVERGWEALAAGNASRAAAEFSAAAREDGRGRAAGIGLIEAQVAAGRVEEAVAACQEALEVADATLPLLVACAEAAAADGRPREGWTLYRQALARTSGRAGLQARAETLRRTAADERMAAARAAAGSGRTEEARRLAGEAVDLAPESAARRAAAAEVELAMGDRQRALARYREALEIDPADAAIAQKAGELALQTGEHGLAVAFFDGLARGDPAFAPRAEEARLIFRAANWPEPEREAARSQKLTRAGAASLVWWMAPEVREAHVTSGVIASDAISRRDSRALTRALALGLLEADRETHRASPDSFLTTGAAARLLVRLLEILEPRTDRIPCGKGVARAPRSGSEVGQLARACGLIDGRESAAVSGPKFVRALDRVRALASAVPGADHE